MPPLSAAVTVIVASPGFFAVTFPLSSTVATHVFLLSHFSALFVAFAGVMLVTLSCFTSSVCMANVDALNVIPDTLISVTFT